ncbi:MAG: aminoglycoside phosphotransferase family protein [Armatimonadetes bacterium]|nr:aminoglycoside phosphotransferase family protein [Armatimonadota bacterium]
MQVADSVTHHFQIDGRVIEEGAIERGHINETRFVVVDNEGDIKRYVHQRINAHIFPDPPKMMDNIARVCAHLLRKRGNPEEILQLVPIHEGLSYYRDDNGEYWRTYRFVENTKVYDIVESPEVAYQAAVAFARFVRDIGDLDHARLHLTIPGFHHTPQRVEVFERTIPEATPERKAAAAAEIDFARRNEDLAEKLVSVMDVRPDTIRAVHNDTKVNNVLFHQETGEAVCVLDLDTIMPGTILFDIGDLIRTACNKAAEDEPDIDCVEFNLQTFQAVIEGYADVLGSDLTEEEWDALPYAGIVMTYQQGVRFLTDYLDGDHYFGIHYPEHNLVRTKCQFALTQKMLDALPEMTRIVEECRA